MNHEIFWTDEKSARFWNYIASNKHNYANSFSYQVGEAVIDFVESRIPLKGEILDFGCGQGFLLEKLIKKGISCQGADFSQNSIDMVQNKLKSDPNFKGSHLIISLPSELSEGQFDIIFSIETIEHLLDTDLDRTMKELYRLLRPNGLIVLTTPNDEDLEASKIICPECGCIFHRVQHVRTWTLETLSKSMRGYGFNEVISKEIAFRPRSPFNILMNAYERLKDSKKPHIIYIGKK